MAHWASIDGPLGHPEWVAKTFIKEGKEFVGILRKAIKDIPIYKGHS